MFFKLRSILILITAVFSAHGFGLSECNYKGSELPGMVWVQVGSSFDTGVILTNRIFLTTGHLLDHVQERGELVFGGQRYSFSGFRNPLYDSQSTYDVTVGVLDHPLSNVEGWTVESNVVLKGEQVAVAGCLYGNLRTNEGRATTMNNGEIHFRPDSSLILGPGDGGGPLWLEGSDGPRLLGILTRLITGKGLIYTGLIPANIRHINEVAERFGLAPPLP